MNALAVLTKSSLCFSSLWMCNTMRRFILCCIMVERKKDLILQRALNNRSLVALVAGMTRRSLSNLHTSDKCSCWAGVHVLKKSMTSNRTTWEFTAALSLKVVDSTVSFQQLGLIEVSAIEVAHKLKLRFTVYVFGRLKK